MKTITTLKKRECL